MSLFAYGLSGCALNMTLVRSQVESPGRIELLFAVEDERGRPVPGLTTSAFQIMEDGAPVSELESKRMILPRQVGFRSYAMLLLDMSGSIVASGSLEPLIGAVESFIRQTSDGSREQALSIAVFDGSETIHRVVDFTTDTDDLLRGLEGLRRYETRDPSTNLNGAVVSGLKAVAVAAEGADVPIVARTVVVFTDGRDRASRVSSRTLDSEIDRSIDRLGTNLFVVGLGGEIDPRALKRIGRGGFEYASDKSGIEAAFEKVSERIRALSERYYVLAYCSPARAGRHELRLVARDGARQGSLRRKFEADEFGPGCDPERPGEALDVSQVSPRALVPPGPLVDLAIARVGATVGQSFGAYGGVWHHYDDGDRFRSDDNTWEEVEGTSMSWEALRLCGTFQGALLRASACAGLEAGPFFASDFNVGLTVPIRVRGEKGGIIPYVAARIALDANDEYYTPVRYGVNAVPGIAWGVDIEVARGFIMTYEGYWGTRERYSEGGFRFGLGIAAFGRPPG